ncbi:MAG: hypothetical protein RMJ00_04110 [Nitrososphaerota archaeon]|nr:hypothetical protein [Candidatus Bathyarchaeota archaeon]MCX8162481.1 hypothetical protein [Candidatus Bathyarchaeota archaeon]MDW8061863.1 hypothetical protein [Nitrososphaerota archaeon]
MSYLTFTRILGFVGLATIIASFTISWAIIRFENLSVEYRLLDLAALMLNPNPAEIGGFKARLILSLFALADPRAVDAVLAFKAHVTLAFLSLIIGVVSVILDMKRIYASTLASIILSSTLFVYAISKLYEYPSPGIALTSYSYDLGIIVYVLNSIVYAVCILAPVEGGSRRSFT